MPRMPTPLPWRRARRTRRPPHTWTAALTALCLAGTAWGQSSPWYLGGLVSTTHDSNLLRLGKGQPAGAGQWQSDTVLSTALVGGLDQALGRQRLSGNLTVRDNRYSRNSRYDNQSYSAGLGLDWSTVERISGQVTAGASRNLSTFNADFVGLLTEKNFETTQGLNASLSVGVITAWSMELSAGHRRVRNSLDRPAVQAQNFDQDDWSLGLAWRPSAALKLSASLRGVQGDFPTFRTTAAGIEGDRYRQRQFNLGASLQASGASLLDLRLGHSRTGYAADTQRDFSGVNGSLTWQWQPTGKLRVNTRLARDRGQDNYPASAPSPLGPVPLTLSDDRLQTTLRGQLDWDLRAKLALSASLQFTRRDVDRNTRDVTRTLLLNTVTGRDDTTITTLGARWTPRRWALLGCDLRHETRSARGEVTADLRGASLGCYGQFTLQ